MLLTGLFYLVAPTILISLVVFRWHCNMLIWVLNTLLRIGYLAPMGLSKAGAGYHLPQNYFKWKGNAFHHKRKIFGERKYIGSKVRLET
ncbi:hypothetical protein [Imperialibacter sp.]|uniref:hypothetical protein n=1 Tax=Imperialibacter sp. TaxID=2038411 RepID=UPI0032EC0BE5